jgi:hypothetical protein
MSLQEKEGKNTWEKNKSIKISDGIKELDFHVSLQKWMYMYIVDNVQKTLEQKQVKVSLCEKQDREEKGRGENYFYYKLFCTT